MHTHTHTHMHTRTHARSNTPIDTDTDTRIYIPTHANTGSLYHHSLTGTHTHTHIQSSSHQSSTAEEDHKDDEGLEPAVLHDLEACLPQPPPGLANPAGRVDLTALTAAHADWGAAEG